MFRPRVIPVLLLKEGFLVKSERFKDYKYIGDPINAVRIFNDLFTDELVFLDILASRQRRLIDVNLVRVIGEEANMPFAVGGGIRSIKDIKTLIQAGAEKVIIGSFAVENPDFIREASEEFGSSTIVVCIDIKRKIIGNPKVCIFGGEKAMSIDPVSFAKLMEEKGAGEIIIQSVDRDGTMKGYDIDLTNSVSRAVKIPIVALGGAGNLEDLKEGYYKGLASGLAAGSMFVYYGNNKGVLINYPEKSDLVF